MFEVAPADPRSWSRFLYAAGHFDESWSGDTHSLQSPMSTLVIGRPARRAALDCNRVSLASRNSNSFSLSAIDDDVGGENLKPEGVDFGDGTRNVDGN